MAAIHIFKTTVIFWTINMKTIYALCDYQGRFGSKYFGEPYKSGMDKEILKKAILDSGYNLHYRYFTDIKFIDTFKNQFVIYTSQEDPGYYYKSFIEDIVYNLEMHGAITIPSYKFLRANNNKVMMELLRKLYLPEMYQLQVMCFGTYEELKREINNIPLPCVLKLSEGAGSKSVFFASSEAELLGKVKNVARTPYFKEEIRDILRLVKYKGYKRKSLYRKKFIVQEFIPDLSNDWKVLIFWDKYYVLRRKNRPNDFRASGSGLFSFDETVDPRLLEAAKEIRGIFDVPMISLDLAISNNRVVLLEFQFLYFGTSTLEKSPYYYVNNKGNWEKILGKSSTENIYAYSIVSYIEEKYK